MGSVAYKRQTRKPFTPSSTTSFTNRRKLNRLATRAISALASVALIQGTKKDQPVLNLLQSI